MRTCHNDSQNGRGLVSLLRPDPRLAAYVRGYIFCNDRLNEHSDVTVKTAPGVLAIVTFHLHEPNRSEDGRPVPMASILGTQSRPRAWRSVPYTRYIAALVTASGLAALFPAMGAAQHNCLHDLRDVIGHDASSELYGTADQVDPVLACAGLDRSLLRLLTQHPDPGAEQLIRFCSALTAGHLPGRAAESAAMSLRAAQRLCRERLGMSPQSYRSLARLQASIALTQHGPNAVTDGFYDQPHMIRNWKPAVGTTPGAYSRGRPGLMAQAMASQIDPGSPRETVFL